MMSEAIIIAIITGLFAVGGNLVVSLKSNKDLSADIKRQTEISDAEIKGEIAVIKSELANLSAKVAEQNSVIERIYHLEQLTAVHDEKIKHLNK